MVRTVVGAGALGVVLLAGCAAGERPAGITLENNPFVKLPRAHATLVGESLTLSTIVDPVTDAAAGFEELNGDHDYHAWARSGGQTAHLGAFTPGVNLEATIGGDADEILISIEEGSPTSPSSTIAVSGPVDGELGFGGLDIVAFSGARATAFIGEGFVELDYQGLPELPDGYRYELWVTPVDEANLPTGDPIAAGALETLPAGAIDRYEDDALPPLLNLNVAVEASGGRGAMSGTSCLELVHAHDEHSGGGGGGHSH